MNHYETVFILNPVLSDEQIKETVKKYEEFLVSKGAEMVSKENWGLKKLAYAIQHKKSGFYHYYYSQLPSRNILSPSERISKETFSKKETFSRKKKKHF